MIQTDLFNTATIEGMLEAPGEKWHRFPPDVIPLYLADLDFPIAMEIKKALLNAVHDEDLFYNSDIDARKAMVEKINAKNGLETTHEDIMVTQGVNPCMWLAIRHTCKEGDGVILTNPMYGPFSNAVRVTSTKPVHWPLEFDEGYRFDVEVLKELITPRTKLLYVCNPHNPCGRVMTEEELKGIADVAVDHKLKVMVDELHEDIVYDGRKHITLASLNPEIEAQTMTAWGFSKTFGVAGLQMGYLCATNKEMIEDLRKQARGVMRGTSTLAKAAAPVMSSKALDWWRRDIVVHLEKIRGICEKRFDEIGGITYSKLEGTYLMFPKFDYGKTSDELRKYLLEEGKIAPSSGTGFGSNGEGNLRFCIATSETIINEVLDRLENALHKLK